jgi:hypothetical protein
LESKRKILSELLAQRVAIANLIVRNANVSMQPPFTNGNSSMNFTPLRLRPSSYLKESGFGLITPDRSFDSPSILSSFISVSPCSKLSQGIQSYNAYSEYLKLPFILMTCPLNERMDCQIDDDLTHVDFSCT